MYKSDYRIRVHRSRGDSGQGEAERTNSAIQDSMVDGGTIHWEKYKKFDDMTEAEIDKMALEDYEQYERKRMEKNAWEVTRELTNRIDGAPVLSSYMKAIESEPAKELFFFNGDSLRAYQAATPLTQKDVPGSAYIKKILDFVDNHYNTGELFMEYLKQDCILRNGELCWHCQVHDWVGPPAVRISQPMADTNRPGHFLPLHDCPRTDENGELRMPDDRQPRANLRKLFKNGDINMSNTAKVEEFALKYCADEDHVVKYLQHLQNLRTLQSIRERSRKQKKQGKLDKDYSRYDWTALMQNGKLQKLLVKELNKYLIHHSLETSGKKSDKVKAIMCQILQREPNVEPFQKEVETESNSEEEVFAIIQSQESSEEADSEIGRCHESDSESDCILMPVTVRTRSGRCAGAFSGLRYHKD